MTDLETAINNLAGHSVCLCRDGSCLYSEKRGIAPIMNLIADGVDLAGYSVADKVVGKAAAMLFVRCGIKQVFAKTLSQNGKIVLERFGIPYRYETLTENIINRDGTDICPMEKTVLNIEDIEEGYTALKNKLKLMG
ncbi:MAG: DUF1893 domain-containing protein, partial [Clostridia bacterium]|nr:DUF1893 domain-containing protein [Clostridia bacterium]